MKAYSLDLRERAVKYIEAGGTKAAAARAFHLCERTVYRYVAAAQTRTLAPKTSWGSWKKLDPKRLKSYVQRHPDATLKELQAVFKVSHNAVWTRLNQLGFTLKKSHALSRARRGAALAVPAGAGALRARTALLSRRMRRGPRAVS